MSISNYNIYRHPFALVERRDTHSFFPGGFLSGGADARLHSPRSSFHGRGWLNAFSPNFSRTDGARDHCNFNHCNRGATQSLYRLISMNISKYDFVGYLLYIAHGLCVGISLRRFFEIVFWGSSSAGGGKKNRRYIPLSYDGGPGSSIIITPGTFRRTFSVCLPPVRQRSEKGRVVVASCTFLSRLARMLPSEQRSLPMPTNAG